MTDKDKKKKKKKKPNNGEKKVSATKIPETNSGYRPTGKQVGLAKKVQERGIDNKLAYQGKDGKIKPRENKALKEKIRQASLFRDRRDKNHPDYKVQDKKVKALERRLHQHNKSAKNSAGVGTAQKNMYNKNGGKGDDYIDRLNNQQNKKKVRIKKNIK